MICRWKKYLQYDLNQKERKTRKEEKKVKLSKRQMKHFTLQSETHSFLQN